MAGIGTRKSNPPLVNHNLADGLPGPSLFYLERFCRSIVLIKVIQAANSLASTRLPAFKNESTGSIGEGSNRCIPTHMVYEGTII